MARTQLRFGLEPNTVARAIRNLEGDVRDAALGAAEDAQAIMEEAIIETAQFYGLSTAVYANVEVYLEADGDGYRVYTEMAAGATKGHEKAVAVYERGHRAYDIVPKAKKAMKFNYFGEDIYRKKVHRPAQAGYNVLRRARDRAYQRIRRGTTESRSIRRRPV